MSAFCGLWPLYEAMQSNDDLFFPIPPNRECIESVDMVLHIPIAVDYFYNYLQSRNEQLQDKQAIHLIALYIDLRLYDKACTEGESMQTKREIAEELYEQYLSSEALLATTAAQMDLEQSYFPVSLDENVKRLF